MLGNSNGRGQCAKCPWLKRVDPRDIPNGYSEEKHRALRSTIADAGDLSALASNEIRVMACHETHKTHCIGWLANQNGDGNNIALRLDMLSCANADKIRLLGEQHKSFEDTLPSA
ncbi:MAG: DUF6283 family protein [Pyrinomonadaceae bacterium]|nr:DUF6283 family protein [Pyrinomonadaceae bacterium]